MSVATIHAALDGSRPRTWPATWTWSPPWSRWRRGYGATAAQLAIAWVLARGADIVPLIGTKRRVRLAEALAALDLALTAADLAAIEAAVPPGAVAGDRNDRHGMATLDSERPAAG